MVLWEVSRCLREDTPQRARCICGFIMDTFCNSSEDFTFTSRCLLFYIYLGRGCSAVWFKLKKLMLFIKFDIKFLNRHAKHLAIARKSINARTSTNTTRDVDDESRNSSKTSPPQTNFYATKNKPDCRWNVEVSFYAEEFQSANQCFPAEIQLRPLSGRAWYSIRHDFPPKFGQSFF